MSDLTRRQYGGQVSGLQQDVERGLRGLRRSLDDLDTEAVGYVPGNPELWDPQPTTLQEALDRIVRWLNARHGGDMPIPE